MSPNKYASDISNAFGVSASNPGQLYFGYVHGGGAVRPSNFSLQ